MIYQHSELYVVDWDRLYLPLANLKWWGISEMILHHCMNRWDGIEPAIQCTGKSY